MKPLTLAAFASGRGSNLAALIEKIHTPGRFGRIAVVVSDQENAGALVHAKKAGIPTVVISYKSGKAAAEAQMIETLRQYDVDLILLCGFMRLLSQSFVAHHPHRIINIHPSLLPAFPGLHAQRQALEAGVKVAGCTVHFVDEGMDTGRILLQASVPVLDGDTEESLSARILEQEHTLYARAVQFLAEHWPPESFLESE